MVDGEKGNGKFANQVPKQYSYGTSGNMSFGKKNSKQGSAFQEEMNMIFDEEHGNDINKRKATMKMYFKGN